jgi:hypothetical protein
MNMQKSLGPPPPNSSRPGYLELDGYIDIRGIWLGPASQGNGAVIPNQIADKLRGRDFPNRAFREALWTAAADAPELSKQFSANNIEEMKHGRALFSRKNDRVGGQVKLEMHHVNHSSKGGEVYDIDNIRVVTPKRHSELHKGGKQYEQLQYLQLCRKRIP